MFRRPAALLLCAALALAEEPDLATAEKEIVGKWQQVQSLTARRRETGESRSPQAVMRRSAAGTIAYAQRAGQTLLRMETESESRLVGGERDTVIRSATTQVCDGEFVWLLTEQTDPRGRNRKMCVKTDPDERPVQVGGAPLLAMLRETFTLTLAPEESVGGDPCWVIVGKAGGERRSGVVEVRQYIRKSDGVPLRQVGLDSDGQTLQTVEFTDIVVGGKIPDETFAFTPPRDAVFLDETKFGRPGMP